MTCITTSPVRASWPRIRTGALVLCLCTLTACSTKDATSPDAPIASALSLSSAGSLTLASFGDTARLTARVTDAQGHALTAPPLKWTVSPTGIVAEDAAGVFRAIGNGAVTISAEIDPAPTGVRPGGYFVGHRRDSVVVVVRQRAAVLALRQLDTTFTTLDASRQMQVILTDRRGNALAGPLPPLAWSAANTAIVTVDSGGRVQSRAEGTGQVTVQAEGLTAGATFTVQPRLPHTACMVFARRRQSRQSCVTLALTLRERTVAP